MCKGFGSTLTGPVLLWFVSLPNRSISTFAELVNAFTQQFASSKKPQKHARDLYRIVQGAGETIGEYNTLFNNEKVTVRECDVSTAVEAFRRGLHHDSDLYKKLTMHPCHSFKVVQEKAAAAIRLEEDILARASLPSTPSVSSTSAVEKSGRKQPTSTGGILKAMREMGDRVRWPKPPVEEQAWRKDSKKKCEFHCDIGHNTEDCYTLRREIKRLISHSDLPAVTFDEGDTYNEREHHDALIITLSMANCTIRKILVDTGSLVNLIMLKTIENMGFSEKDLQKKTIPLVGFSGEISNSLGEIDIPTYVGGVNKQIRGIEASIEQIKAVLQLESPEKPKDVQSLPGKVAALSRFISRSLDKCRLFYDILRKSQKFEWIAEHEHAFRELKHYLSSPPLLSKPEPGEPLFL
ncbi:uncharacterized protein LOC141614152 [Silene latifolia]|uniref:uncharacterized protein LOC141614152 n=1 Tax=Silene latifolia TaxID=37657 RepID=UPI003D778053